MTNVYLRIVRSDGKEFYADGKRYGDADWGITKLSGIGIVESEYFTENKAVGDGDIVNGRRMKSRSISFDLVAKNVFMNKVLRKAAISFFNAKYDFNIYVTYQGETKWITGVLDVIDIPSNALREQQKVSGEFLCADPFFKSVDEFGADIASTTPLWTFEEIDDPDWGEPFDYYNFGQAIDVSNDGDVETYCRIVIRATGQVTNPKFMHNNAYIRIIDTMQPNDVVEIDIVNRSVTKNGENILAKIDRTSDFVGMTFEVGDNKVSYDADVGETAMSVTLFYNKLYLGV